MNATQFKASMNTKFGIGCETIKAKTLKDAHAKAIKKHGDKLIMTWDAETGDEIFASSEDMDLF